MKILYALLITACFAGKVCLPKHTSFHWEFEKDTIKFTLNLTKEVLSKFDFIGIGALIDIRTDGNYEADVIGLVFGGRIDDAANIYGAIFYDQDLKTAKEDILRQSFDPINYSYTWERPLNTPETDSRLDFYYAPGVSANWFFDLGIIIEGLPGPIRVADRYITYFALDDRSYDCGEKFLGV